jgi:hypothetical protein
MTTGGASGYRVLRFRVRRLRHSRAGKHGMTGVRDQGAASHGVNSRELSFEVFVPLAGSKVRNIWFFSLYVAGKSV